MEHLGYSSGNGSKPAVIRLVQPEEVGRYWAAIEHLLELGREHWEKYETMAGIRDRLEKGTNQFWIAQDAFGPFLGMLSAVEVFESGFRQFRVIWLGGEMLKNILDYFFVAEEYARKRDCSEIVIYCRPAIMRLLRKQGFRPRYHVITKPLQFKLTEH